MIPGRGRSQERPRAVTGIPLVFAAAIFLGTCHVVTSDSDVVSWWNIEMFLREFVNGGLRASYLQDYLDTEFKWENRVVDGRETLDKIKVRAMNIFEGTIRNLRKLKNAIEEEYERWPTLNTSEINDRELCCQTDEPFPSGCTILATRLNKNAEVRAIRPPSFILTQLQRMATFKTNTTQYFTFDDGSLFMHPPKTRKQLLTCEEYDPRLRYFYTQSKSPEPRNVVVVVDNITKDSLLEHTINRVFSALTPIDRIGLCVPEGNSCRTFDEIKGFARSKWPRDDGPLGQKEFLGRLLSNNKVNRAKLIDLLQKVEDKCKPGRPCTAFEDHAAALRAGLALLAEKYKPSYNLMGGESHSVLVYVTIRGRWNNWQEDEALLQQFNASLDRGISIVINHLHDKPEGLEEGVIMERNNSTVTVFSFRDKDELYASETGIASYGLEVANRPVIPMPYWDAFGDGYIMSVCLTLMHNDSFVGTVCSDLSIINLLEAELNVDDIEGGYVFIVDSRGRALKHPLLPSAHTLKDDPTYVTIDKLEIGPEVKPILDKVLRQEAGNETLPSGTYVQSLGHPRGIEIPSAVRVRRRSLQYLWAPINETDLTIVVVLPTNKSGQVISTVYKCRTPDECVTRHFKNSKANINESRTSDIKDEGLIKFAPDCFIDVLSYVNGKIDPSQIRAVFNGTLPYDELFREDLRPSVKLLEVAEEKWKNNHEWRNYTGTLYMGTEDGSFITFPGKKLNRSFDHRDRTWYQTALSTIDTDSISMTTPYCDEWGLGMVYTIAKTLHDQRGNPQAVVAGDFTLDSIMQHFNNLVPNCKQHTCFLLDHLGFVVLKADWDLSWAPSRCPNGTEITGSHIISAAPDIARDLIAERYLNRRACHDYENDLTYYYWSLFFPAFRTWHEGPNYGIHKIASTNLFLAFRTERSTNVQCYCNFYPEVELDKCHDTCDLECECPCVGGHNTNACHTPDADLHRRPLPACKPRGLTLVSARNDTR